MGWSNDQATTLDGQAFTYTNTTVEYSTGSALTIDADASIYIAPGLLDPLDLRGDTLGYARYSAAANQSIPNATNTYVSFGTADQTDSLVTPAVAGPGSYFIFGVGGIWAVTSTIRFLAGADGERYGALQSNNYGAQQVITDSGGWGTSVPHTITLSYIGYFPANTWVLTSAFQSTGGSLSLEGNSQWKNMNIALLRKYSP